MSFEKKDWKYRDTITADELNRMEDGIEEAISGGSAGYSCTETTTLLTDESVTTVADEDSYEGNLAYSTPITADTIKVTFDSVEYICNRRSAPNNNCEYGASWDDATESYDFSEFPFKVNSSSRGNLLVTATAGTYQVKIEAFEETVETSECFKKAVESVMSAIPTPSVLQLIPGVTTKAEVEQANANGTLMYVQGSTNPSSRMYAFVQSYFNGGFSTIPDQNTLGWRVEIQNGVVALVLGIE